MLLSAHPAFPLTLTLVAPALPALISTHLASPATLQYASPAPPVNISVVIHASLALPCCLTVIFALMPPSAQPATLMDT
jgi:hypothetical protein